MKSSSYIVRKIVFWITFLEMVIINQIAWASASPDTIVKVEPYANTAHSGGTFTINVTLTDVHSLYGLEVGLHWNASVLKIVGVDVRIGVESHPDGVLHEPIFMAQNETIQEEGKYLLVGTSTAPANPYSGHGNIVRITFKVTNTGNTKLRLETKLADRPSPGRVASPIVHTAINGVFSPVHVFISSATATAGENVNISGFIALARANVDVTIQYRQVDETDWHILSIVKTNEKGNYQHIWQPSESGKYEIIAAALIDDVREKSFSVYLIVEKLEYIVVWQSILFLVLIVIGIIAIALQHEC